METLNSHPVTAQQAKSFISPTSLSMPGGAGDLTPPSEQDGTQPNGMNGALGSGEHANGTGVIPSTPAATPGAVTGASGIVPALQ